jgi:hypothetical protein
VTAHPDLVRLVEDWSEGELGEVNKEFCAGLADALTAAVCEMVAAGLEAEVKGHGRVVFPNVQRAVIRLVARIRAGEWTGGPR